MFFEKKITFIADFPTRKSKVFNSIYMYIEITAIVMCFSIYFDELMTICNNLGKGARIKNSGFCKWSDH